MVSNEANKKKKGILKKYSKKANAFKDFYGPLLCLEDINELEPSRVWCVDTTYFGPIHDPTNPYGVSLFSVLNLGSRRVLGFILVGGGKDINSDHILSCLETCIKESNSLKPRYIHFDQHRAHMSENLKTFFWEEEIKVSLSMGRFKNQQAESFHSQLKTILILIFLKLYSNQKNLFEKKLGLNWSFYVNYSFKQRSQALEVRSACFKLPEFPSFLNQNIEKAIELVNNSKVKAVNRTRNEVDVFLYVTEYPLGVKETSKKKPLKQMDDVNERALIRGIDMVKKDIDELTAEEIDNLALEINRDPLGVEKTQVRSLSLLMGEFKQLGGALKEAQADRDKEKLERKKEREEFFQAQEKMLAHIKDIESELIKTRIREEKTEEASRLKQLRREKRNRPKNPSSAISREHFDFLMKSLKSEPDSETFPKLRERMLFLLLFVTGLRISEVRQFRVDNIQKLFLSKEPSLRVYLKKQRKYHHAFLSKDGLDLLRAYRPMFKKLAKYLGDKDAFLFSDKNKQNEVLNRDYLNRETNRTLQKVLNSKYEGKKFTSHGFRRGVIEHLWLVTGDLEFVCQYIGHEKIGTTHGYITQSEGVLKQAMNRHGLTPKSDVNDNSS